MPRTQKIIRENDKIINDRIIGYTKVYKPIQKILSHYHVYESLQTDTKTYGRIIGYTKVYKLIRKYTVVLSRIRKFTNRYKNIRSYYHVYGKYTKRHENIRSYYHVYESVRRHIGGTTLCRIKVNEIGITFPDTFYYIKQCFI